MTGTDSGIQDTITPQRTGGGSGVHQGNSEGDFIAGSPKVQVVKITSLILQKVLPRKKRKFRHYLDKRDGK
jgi:hypothetical protein